MHSLQQTWGSPVVLRPHFEVHESTGLFPLALAVGAPCLRACRERMGVGTLLNHFPNLTSYLWASSITRGANVGDVGSREGY